MSERPGSRVQARVIAIEDGSRSARSDFVATEEPLEVRVEAGSATETVAVTMRTPGADFELAAGFLHGEGVISSPDDVDRIRYCRDRNITPEQLFNIVTVQLRSAALPDLASLQRHFYATSACGVCGKASLEALELRGCEPVPPGPQMSVATIRGLPEKLLHAQKVFESTGGLHACGLFDAHGELLAAREDVGRHNAVDKLVGWALLAGRLPLRDHILLVSGRSSFEILQKALVAGIPTVCAVSAPSSLAVSVARRFGVTLVGFLRGERFNVYSGPERIEPEPRT